MDSRRNKKIYDLLIELQKHGEAFNKMVGTLYSGICADEINTILNKLKKNYNVEVSYYQWIPGRIEFNNLESLIKTYSPCTS